MTALPRCFNKNLIPLESFHSSKSYYGHRYIKNPMVVQNIIDKLDLKSKYPKGDNLKIIDIFPGSGLFSTMLNQELQPKQHYLIEPHPAFSKIWNEGILPNQTTENFVLDTRDGYSWGTYSEIGREGKFVPSTHDRSEIHPEFLIVGNITHTNGGAALLQQWITCMNNRNWLQRYGRVRMILTVSEQNAHRYSAAPGETNRSRGTVLLNAIGRSRLVGVCNPVGKERSVTYTKHLLETDDPVRFNRSDVVKDGLSLAVLEVVPHAEIAAETDVLEFLTKQLFILNSKPLAAGLDNVGPGFQEWCSTRLSPELLQRSPQDLSDSDVLEICRQFESWPFKPPVLLTFFDGDSSVSV